MIGIGLFTSKDVSQLMRGSDEARAWKVVTLRLRFVC